MNRLENALKGMAVADATGVPFEFNCDPNPRDVLSFAKYSELRISDDTQMTLFGFSACREIIENSIKGDSSDVFVKHYLDWHETQDECFDGGVGLLQFPELYNRVAPGNTCLSALDALSKNIGVKNNSLGCGSVMRLLPIVLLFDFMSLDKCKQIANESASVTHKHPDNKLAVDKLIQAYYDIWLGKHLPKASGDSISDYGEGWISTECVDMALWAFTNASTFDELLTLSVCHDGDSDSVAAIAGSLWGLAGNKVNYFENIKEQQSIQYTITNMLSFKSWDELQESKQVGILYHFTTPAYFEMIISPEHQKTNLGIAKSFVLYGTRGVSFTRNSELSMFNSDVSLNNGYSIRIAIDGDKLSNKYKIKPVAGLTYNAPSFNDVLDIKNKNRVDRSSGEHEELIIHSSSLVDISDSIIQIDIINRPYQNYPLTWYDNIKEELIKLKIPVTISKKLNKVRR